MTVLSGFGRRDLGLRWALAGLCVVLVAGCETQVVVLSPPLHARVVDGETRKPLDGVRVTLISEDGPETAMAYSDPAGHVDMPGMLAQPRTLFQVMTDRPHPAVRALFERPGYEPYMIDSVTGYGFFRGYTPVHLYPE